MTDDQPIIEKILAGEREVFRLLVERYEDAIMRISYHILHDRHAAEDVCQDVFVSAYRRLASFDGRKGKFSTWLYAIARNASINAGKKRRPAPAGDWVDDRGAEDREVEGAEIRRALDAALAELPEERRRAFVFAEIEGMPLAEVAAIEGVAEGTIKSRLGRAREALRTKLSSVYKDTIQ